MLHFIEFNNDFQADVHVVMFLDFLLDFLFQSYEDFCVLYLYGV